MNDIEKLKKLAAPAAVLLTLIILITVIYVKRKNVTINIDGKKKNIITYKSTVKQALLEQNIPFSKYDKIKPGLNSKIHKSSLISIKKAFQVTINSDGKDYKYMATRDDNIPSLLKKFNIALGNMDKISPSIDTKLTGNINVDIIRVTTKTFTETVPVNYKTVVQYDGDLACNKNTTLQQGKAGQKQASYDVTYENGKEVKRTEKKVISCINPVDMIICQGTCPIVTVSRGGDCVPYSKKFNVRATAYYALSGVGKTYTASGRKAVRDPDGYSTIAVDPSVIPLGTRLFVEGYGLAVAADTGTAVKGNTIDVFFDTTSEMDSWAVKNVNVYILK